MDNLWYRLRQEGHEPESVASPDEFQGGSNLNVVCTQLVGRSAHQQRKLVDAWCEALPDLAGVRTLWFCSGLVRWASAPAMPSQAPLGPRLAPTVGPRPMSRGLERMQVSGASGLTHGACPRRGASALWFHSRVPERLFEAACTVPGLETLFIKRSGVKSLEPVAQMSSLRSLFLGSAPGVESLEPLGNLSGLRWLTIETHWRAERLDPLSRLTPLEGLSITGRSRTHVVESLGPIGELVQLRYLDLVDLRAKDGTRRPLYALTDLETFESARWWPDEELAEICRRNPGLG